MKTKLANLLMILCLPAFAHGQIAGGGGFSLERAVVAAGGGASASGDFSLSGTSGQAAAGRAAGGAAFTLAGGFWTPAPLGPTAATVALGGRVMLAGGSGVFDARVTLTDGSGAIRTAATNNLGYYQFAEVRAGETYIVSVRHKRFDFTVPTVVLFVDETRGDLDFTAFSD